jgi:hypothetical protein
MTSLLFAVLLATATAESAETAVTLLDGSVATGEIQSWDARQVTLATAEGKASFPAAKLLDVRWPRDAAPLADATHVELIDGTRLTYSEFLVADHKAEVAGRSFKQPLTIPREAIRLVELRPSTPLIARALEEIERKQAAGDALVVAQRDSESMDYLTGVIGDVTAEQASFEWDGERVPVKRSKIAAMVFYQARDLSLPEALCELSLVDGSRIVASEVGLREGLVYVTTPAGVELTVPVNQVVRADFSTGKIAFLSDLKPTDVRWTPGLGVPEGESISARSMPRSDSSFSGTPLALLWKDDVSRTRRDVRTYAKGLALRSRTELTYRLPDGMTHFVATAGIDPDSGGQGNVWLMIRGDDRVLWEGAVDGRRPPVEIDVELGAARRLHLTVDYGENLDYGDRVHLVEARVTK